MASTPKTMSNRLMTMKFMQRSASKSAGTQSPTQDGHPAKKVRLSNGTSTPTSIDAPTHHEAAQAVIDAEEKKRQEALDKVAESAGETKWVLSFQDPREGSRKASMHVVQAGFAVIDAGDDEDEDEGEIQPARIQFGGGVKREEKRKPSDGSEDSDDDSDSSDLDSDDPAAELIREAKKESAARARQNQKPGDAIREGPRKRSSTLIDEDSDLGALTSISGGRSGGAPSGGGRGASNVECYSCGQIGHRKQDCPNRGRGFGGRGGKGSRR